MKKKKHDKKGKATRKQVAVEYIHLSSRIKIMNKAELVAAIAKEADLTKKQAEAAVNAFTKTVVGEVANGGNVQLVGFGTFEQSERSARKGRNPQSGEPMDIPASTVPKFKAGKAFKDAVNA